ncbi:hypothetical protein B0J14DRAFT_563852 [Halenospora varia]|nr:hypothetical protein B0J14DRAFT_563852 [Halenospora varia]
MAAFNARGQNLDPELGNVAHSTHPIPSDPPPSYQNTITNPPPIYHPPNSSSTPNRSANSRDPFQNHSRTSSNNSRDPFQNHSRTSSNNSRDPFSSNYSRAAAPNPPRDPFAYRAYRNDHDMLMDHFKATQSADGRRGQVINGPDKNKQKKAIGKFVIYLAIFILFLVVGLGVFHGIKIREDRGRVSKLFGKVRKDKRRTSGGSLDDFGEEIGRDKRAMIKRRNILGEIMKTGFEITKLRAAPNVIIRWKSPN